MAMTLLVATSVAWAATVNCSFAGTCSGTNAGDTIYGGEGNNVIYGRDGDDRIYGRGGDDFIYGMDGNDDLHGSEGNDTLRGGDGSDIHNGGPRSDTFDGGPYSDQYRDDSMYSADTYFGLKVNSVTGEPLFTGIDAVRDYGGNDDSINLSTLNRSQVEINWYDSADADANLDYLRFWQKGTTTNGMEIFNYFGNSGGPPNRGGRCHRGLQVQGRHNPPVPHPRGVKTPSGGREKASVNAHTGAGFLQPVPLFVPVGL
jgi:Ca2+-binding RTX toxin-like protein